MYDVLILNPRFDKPEDRTWHESFVEGLAVIMYTESKELVPVPTTPDDDQAVEYTNSAASKNKLMKEMLWELFYGVLFQFYVEEVSQASNPFDDPIFSQRAMSLIFH
jgi:hypothetical protein